MARSLKTEAVVLRSIRYAEADRVLHLYTEQRGRVNAIAKGVRKTASRFGGRLEPLTHAALMLHEGRGELLTVSGADIVHAHQDTRDDPGRLAVGLIGAEAVLKLFVEPEANQRAFGGLTRFLDLLDSRAVPGDPSLDALGLAFQLKLLTVAGYLPHLDSCASCGSPGPLVGFSAVAGGAVCERCLATSGGFRLGEGSAAAVEALIERPLDRAEAAPRAARDALRIVEATYEQHGGFRLRTLHAGIARP
jgi:DNA repair protein RecO (recombination protein O)